MSFSSLFNKRWITKFTNNLLCFSILISRLTQFDVSPEELSYQWTYPFESERVEYTARVNVLNILNGIIFLPIMWYSKFGSFEEKIYSEVSIRYIVPIKWKQSKKHSNFKSLRISLALDQRRETSKTSHVAMPSTSHSDIPSHIDWLSQCILAHGTWRLESNLQ